MLMPTQEATSNVDRPVQRFKGKSARDSADCKPTKFLPFNGRRNDVDSHGRQQRPGPERGQKSEDEVGRFPQPGRDRAEAKRRG